MNDIVIHFTVNPMLLTFVVGLLLLIPVVAFSLGEDSPEKKNDWWPYPVVVTLLFLGGILVLSSVIGGFLVGVGLVK